MAKARKPKNEEAKAENSGAVVRHQKLCLSVDFDSRQIYGYTEIEVAVPDIGIVGLHAENLGIQSVLVDGEPTEFEYYPHHQNSEDESCWSSVSNPSSAADAAATAYVSALDRELVANLLINCCKPSKALNEQQEQMNLENGSQSSGEIKQNVKLVRINYWIEKAEAGIHFTANAIHTDNQIRRARCWFPCIDNVYQRCSYDLEFTVPQNFVAVSVGDLLYQVLNKDDPPRKTYVYKLNIPVAPRWISLIVAPFEILPDRHNVLISHMCLPSNLPQLYNTLEFFHEAFSYYEDYLNAKFPFKSYKQLFLPPEMTVSSSTLGASLSIFSSDVLHDERVIDQIMDTRIKLASALAKQWFGIYITPESSNDEWLVDGLAGFLADIFIKKFLGNNEACFRRYKANCAVCKADDSGVTSLSSSASCKDLYGTHCVGLYGKIRLWKSVAVLQMLEKQMGPESFRKILQKIIARAKDPSSPVRSLSTKEFRHFANKVGNLERPFLKEFFNRWVASCGCPVLRIGFSYNKRKNIVEMAALRECTASSDARSSVPGANLDLENRDADVGWPGIMSIRVCELDGMSDHPKLPMAGDAWQLLEIPCHSKLAARRYQKTKKGSKPEGSDDNIDAVAPLDNRSSAESPLSWIRADPEMEYLAEIHLHQPLQMLINQLEKDEDVVAQSQAIAALESLGQPSFSIVTALKNILCDSKAFWRVRVEAAFALAKTASEETDWAGLQHLVKFYKGQRFDPEIGLPKPNDFCDFPEYFVLEAIPHAIAMVRGPENKSPREAVEFILQLLKYNDNSGNPYSDVFWLAALVQSVGDLEFGQQSIMFLSPLLKRIDQLLQFDRLVPSHNGILTISCIRTLAQIAMKLCDFIKFDHVCQLIEPFRSKALLQVRVEANKALIDLEFHSKGINPAISSFVKYTGEEPSLRGQVKLCVHAMRLCQLVVGSDSGDAIDNGTLLALLHLLESRTAFNNVLFRHHLFCILRILAERPPTLHGIPKDKILRRGDMETCIESKNIFAALLPENGPTNPELAVDREKPPEPSAALASVAKLREPSTDLIPQVNPPEPLADIPQMNHVEPSLAPLVEVQPRECTTDHPEDLSRENLVVEGTPKEAEDASTCVSHEKKMPVFRFTLKSSAATSRVEEGETRTAERSQGAHHEIDRGATSSVSVDAPHRNSAEAVSVSNQNVEEVNSCHDHGSRTTASIGSVKLASEGDNFGKEFQCTAESGKISGQPQADNRYMQENVSATDTQRYASLQTLSSGRYQDASLPHDKGKDKKKDKEKDKEKKDREKKRKREDPEYLQRKRLKKEKKQKEKEMAKLLNESAKAPQVPAEPPQKKDEGPASKSATVQPEPDGCKTVVTTMTEGKPEPSQGRPAPAPKFRIKFKSKTFGKP